MRKRLARPSRPMRSTGQRERSAMDAAQAPQAAGGARAAPGRHGADIARARSQAARLRMTIRGNPEPSESEWQALGQAHWRGDPLADAVIDWMHAEGLDRTWPKVHAALASGPEFVNEADTALRAYMQHTAEIPPWLNAARMRRGAQVLQTTGLHGMMVLRDAALMAGYQASAINQTLVLTGALSGSAHKRVAETAAWWLACTANAGMDLGAQPGHVPGRAGWRRGGRLPALACVACMGATQTARPPAGGRCRDRKSTRLNSSHTDISRMPSSA